MLLCAPCHPYSQKLVHRQILYIKSEAYRCLIEAKNLMEQYIEMNTGFDSLRIQFDFNPINTS